MPLAGAVALGMGLTMLLWAASVIGHAIAMSGAVEPWVGAAIPGAVSVLIAGLALWRA
jgi:lipopolysaccharide export LptBFGC system permease protein LptF